MGFQNKMDTSGMEKNTKNNYASVARTSTIKKVQAGIQETHGDQFKAGKLKVRNNE